jgi:hypothetical protein
VDLADRRLGHLLEQVPPGEQRPAEGAQAAGVLREIAQVVEVHPGREHRALAAHHHDAHLGVGGRGLDGGAELSDQVAVEGVALLRTVEDEVADRAAVLCADQ